MAAKQPLKGSSDAELLKAIREFEDIIGGLIPRRFSPPFGWKFGATGFLARFGDQLSSMALLIEHAHYTDAAIVLRSIYESSVMFCWISVDPDSRFPRWMDHSERGRSSAISEAREKFGIDPPAGEADRRAELQGIDTNLADRARDADTHWLERLDAFRPVGPGAEGLLTLEGMYTAIYRALSRAAHAGVESIDPVLDVEADPVVITSETRVRRKPHAMGLCIPLVGFGLVVFNHQFGGLNARRVGDVSRNLGEPLDG